MSDERYESFMGLGPKRIAHWEHWSNPDAEAYLTGIDYYEHPRLCRLKLKELYPQLGLSVPEKDEPKMRPDQQEDQGKGRWGDSYRDHWQQEEAGARFASHEEMLSFSPLEYGDFTDWHVVESADFRNEETIYNRYRKGYPAEWGDTAPEGSSAFVDDVMVCGARGITSEPFTNYKAIARRYENCFIAGEGDNRILMRNDPNEIRSMVASMVETGRMSGGYMMCIGNHIPFNVPPEAVKLYLDLSVELGHR